MEAIFWPTMPIFHLRSANQLIPRAPQSSLWAKLPVGGVVGAPMPLVAQLGKVAGGPLGQVVGAPMPFGNFGCMCNWAKLLVGEVAAGAPIATATGAQQCAGLGSRKCYFIGQRLATH